MKKRLLSTLFSSVLFAFAIENTQAQLADGSNGPDFTATDVISNNQINLYSISNQGKFVVMDISAHWCNPCWSYHNSGVLENVWDTYGPPGTNEMYVIWVDGDANSSKAILQGGSPSQGPWLTGTPYPMIGPNGEGKKIADDYKISYYPTMYVVCPDKKTTEVGQLNSASAFYSWATSNCGKLTGTNNAGLNKLTTTATYFCGTYTPQIELENYGSANLTSCDITLSVNSTAVQTINWTGNLAPYGYEVLSFNPVSITGNSSLAFMVSKPNGGTDDYTNNDSKSYNVSEKVSSKTINITLKTDDYPGEITLTIKDDQGNQIFKTPAYTASDAQKTFNYTVALPSAGCYIFEAKDTYGDGIPGGTLTVKATNGTTIFNKVAYGKGESVPFRCDATAGIVHTANNFEHLNVHPNPASHYAVIDFSMTESINVKLSVVNVLGKVVLEEQLGNLTTDNKRYALNTSLLEAGIYIVKLESNDHAITSKLIITK